MRMTRVFLASGVAVLVALAAAGGAGDQKITRSELPPAVEKALAEQSKDATVRGLAKETEGGKTYYEAELTINGHGRDILMDESGKVVEIEEELALGALPLAVRDGLRKAAGAGEIVKVESLTKSGKLVAYEAVVKTGGKRAEVQVDPNGNRLPPKQ